MKSPIVKVDAFFDSQKEPLDLKLVAGAKGLKRHIKEPTVNRPGLAMAGYLKYFAYKRVQVLGNAEMHFLKSLSRQESEARCEELFRHRIPCFIFSRNLLPTKILLEKAEQHHTPIFRSPHTTMRIINKATLALEEMFAPRKGEQGSMVDILGVGVIIKGKSGIGKSESVLALIERGYSLVSDDVTQVRVLDEREIVGSSAALTKDHMEVRGIGIINVAAMFGIKSIRSEKRVDVVVSLKEWSEVSDVDRIGLDVSSVTILGVKIPHIVIPVRPGRDLARLIEVAAFQVKLRAAGHDSAEEFNQRLIAEMAKEVKK